LAPSVTTPITLYDEAKFTVPAAALAAVTVRLMAAVFVRLLDLPVTVAVQVPAAAEADAVSVRVAVAGVAPALNDPTTPLGKPETLTVTVLLNPFCGLRLRVLVPLAPFWMLRAVGEADNVKVGGRAMVSAMAAVLFRAPETPVIVTVAVAAAALLAAVKVTARVWPTSGPKAAVTPAGNPEAVSATVPLKAFTAVMAMLLVPLAPALTLTLDGVAESVKLGGATTVMVMLAVLVMVPEVPVTVMVEGPGIAVPKALNVNVVVCAAVGRNVAVTPAGRPVAESVTVPVKPPLRVSVMVLVALPPCGTLRLAGDAAMV
jgi:hypothetical protein